MSALSRCPEFSGGGGSISAGGKIVDNAGICQRFGQFEFVFAEAVPRLIRRISRVIEPRSLPGRGRILNHYVVWYQSFIADLVVTVPPQGRAVAGPRDVNLPPCKHDEEVWKWLWPVRAALHQIACRGARLGLFMAKSLIFCKGQTVAFSVVKTHYDC